VAALHSTAAALVMEAAASCHFFFTGSCSALILLANFNITAWENDPQLALLNCFLAIGMLWLTVYFGLRYKRALERIEGLATVSGSLIAMAGPSGRTERRAPAQPFTSACDFGTLN